MNKFTKSLLFIILASNVVACIETQSDPRITAFTQNTPKRMEFIDSGNFDRQLSEAMKNQHYEIEVAVLTPFSTNNIPRKLDTWLTAIGSFEGLI